MLDIKFIRGNSDLVKRAVSNKGLSLDIDKLLKLDEQRRKLKTEQQELQAQKNLASKEIPKLSDTEKKKRIAEMKKVDVRSEKIKKELVDMETEYQGIMLQVPNIPSDDTPVGPDEKANLEIGKFGEIPQFDFKIKSHIELGTALGLLDLGRGVKVSGFRGYFLKNEAVTMHFGVLMLALQKLIKAGFTPLVPPTLVRESVLVGSGHFPFGKEEIYQIKKGMYEVEFGKEIPAEARELGNIYLAGTSEPSLLAYHSNEILNEKDLPVKLCGISPCYRSEVGSYGKDTKGVYRIHEFMKVEQVVFCENSIETSMKLMAELEEISKEILEELRLPYRIVANSTGDMGAGKYAMHDIETWMPARGSYGETHSNSALTDWQARRLNIRYKTKDGSIKFVHTLNNTAIASPRILIAIWENYQKEDGSIEVPKVLREYVGKDVVKI